MLLAMYIIGYVKFSFSISLRMLQFSSRAILYIIYITVVVFLSTDSALFRIGSRISDSRLHLKQNVVGAVLRDSQLVHVKPHKRPPIRLTFGFFMGTPESRKT